ncbi:Acetyl xylan esterase (AXE1) [uncultured archaeon]|nr:Acetyl xylan esterase (AXE1) [uncultured archaeon]
MHPYLKGKRFIAVLATIVLLVFAVPHILDAFKPGDKWSISEDGLVSYPQNRGAVEYTKTILNDTPQFTLSKIVYKSKGENIYALLRIPKTSGKMPALILLPGAQVTKEAEQYVAAKLAGWGYITLAIDERGNVGETKGGFNSMDAEYAAFIQDYEPVQHKMVFDVLRAFDFLAEQKDVDANNIAVFGESMGGRYGIMAAAIEPRIKGVIGISTAGYDSLSKQFQDENVARFFRSIDPDAYIGKIAPRQLLLIHSTNDSVIPIAMAQASFNYANEPKKFVTVTCRTHGWCDDMEPALKEELEKIFRD